MTAPTDRPVTPEEFHERLVALAMEAFFRATMLDDGKLAVIDARARWRVEFERRVRERMAQAAQAYAAALLLSEQDR